MGKLTLIKGIKLILMLQWLSMLSYTDSYFAVYAVVFAVSLYCYFSLSNDKPESSTDNDRNKTDGFIISLYSSIFSLFVILSNYRIWTESLIKDDYAGAVRKMYIIIMLAFISVGSFIVFSNIFRYIHRNHSRFNITAVKQDENSKPHRVFLTLFAVITAVDCFVMFTCMYPGVIISDSVSQMEQIVSGVYSNHHPFYQTILIKPFVTAGITLFGDINAGVAMYTVFQVAIMAAIIAFTVMTMYETGVPKRILYVVSIVYLLMPYHLMFSFNIWKDTIFSGCVMLYVVVCFRLLKKTGQMTLNYCLLALSGIGTCLLRSNGFVAFVVAIIAFVAIFGIKDKKPVMIMIGVVVLSFVLKHPVLDAINVVEPDLTESLAIPIQQVARVIYDGGEITGNDHEMIEKLGEKDKMGTLYDPGVADPVKFYLAGNGAGQTIGADKAGYLNSYVSIGMKHPWSYMKGWIDQTKGYWNGGYRYWGVWAYTVDANDIGLGRTTFIGPMMTLVRSYCSAFYNIPILQIFISIGFHVWLLLVVLFVAVIKKDRLIIFTTIPVFAVILTLLVATPGFSEFRYAYAVFCVLPFAGVECLVGESEFAGDSAKIM